MNCEHKKRHIAKVDVIYVSDVDSFRAEVRIWCQECGLPMRFKGVRAGLHPSIPTVSVVGEELRLAIEPIDIDGPLHPAVAAKIMLPQDQRQPSP